MRYQLLTGVALAALSASVFGAVAQERNPANASPGAASSSTSERGGAAGRSEERPAQGQRASEGAGREGATRNANERGQERSAQGRDNNDQKGAAPSAASGRDDAKDSKQNPSSAQSNERDQKGGAAPTSSGSTQRSGSDRPAPSAAGANERKEGAASPTANERDSNRDRAQSPTSPREGASTRTGSDQTRSDQTRSAGGGGQGGGNVQVRGELDVDQQAATRVHERLIRDGGARETNVNIKIDVGGRIPDTIRLRPVPAEIIQISPRYRTYEYTIVRDEIIIVEPKTKKIVQVISSGGGGGKSAIVVRLDSKQRDLVKRDVLKSRTGAVNRQDFNLELRQGMEVPDRVTLQTFPEDIWRDAPELREVRYFIVQDEVVLVDPDTREVIEILR